MKRLYLTVEGATEAAFAISVLGPHLANYGVFLYPPRFTGLHKRRRGRIPGGGLLSTFAHALSDMQTWLKEDRSPDARFSMMVDLYSLPHDFPGYADGMAKATGREQADASHPKYRIQQRVRQYDENVAGPLLAEDIGLPILRERCPHFGQWLTRLEQLDAGGA